MPVRSKSDRLFLDFRWRNIRCREFTGLPDTTENRSRAETLMRLVDAEIALGTFEYRRHFPDGPRLRDFYPDETRFPTPITTAAYLRSWHERRSPFLPDGSVAEGADLHPSTWIHDESIIRCHLEPAVGAIPLHELRPRRLKEFRKELQDKGLSGKTVMNVLGLLHKACEDAVEDGLLR